MKNSDNAGRIRESVFKSKPMNIIKLKALSVNDAYRGRRFSTPELEAFKESLWYLLPKIEVPIGKLEVWYVFGVSSLNADGDNHIKAFQDVLQDKYGFNDRVIYKWHGEKVDVKKGDEYIGFEIKKLID